VRFRVIRPFRWLGDVRMPGQTLEIDIAQAARFRAHGLIGQAEQAVKLPAERAVAPAPERAVRPPAEQRKRTYKPRKKAAP